MLMVGCANMTAFDVLDRSSQNVGVYWHLVVEFMRVAQSRMRQRARSIVALT